MREFETALVVLKHNAVSWLPSVFLARIDSCDLSEWDEIQEFMSESQDLDRFMQFGRLSGEDSDLDPTILDGPCQATVRWSLINGIFLLTPEEAQAWVREHVNKLTASELDNIVDWSIANFGSGRSKNDEAPE